MTVKRNVNVNAQNKSVAEALNKVFEGTDIYYAMEGKNIICLLYTSVHLHLRMMRGGDDESFPGMMGHIEISFTV